MTVVSIRTLTQPADNRLFVSRFAVPSCPVRASLAGRRMSRRMLRNTTRNSPPRSPNLALPVAPRKCACLATTDSPNDGTKNSRQVLLILTRFIAWKYVLFPRLSGLNEHHG